MSVLNVGKSHVEGLIALAGNRFACLHNGIITIWDATTETQIAKLNKLKGEVLCMKRMPDGNLVAGCKDRTIRIWDTTDYTCIKTLTNIPATAIELEPLPNNRLACICYGYDYVRAPYSDLLGNDKEVLIWCIETDKVLVKIDSSDLAKFYRLTTLPNGLLYAAGNMYDMTTFAKVIELDFEQIGRIFHLKDDLYLHAMKPYRLEGYTYTLLLSRLNGDVLYSVKAGKNYGIRNACVLPDGRIITSGADTDIQEWVLNEDGFHLVNSYKVSKDCRRSDDKPLILLEDGRIACGTGYGEIHLIPV